MVSGRILELIEVARPEQICLMEDCVSVCINASRRTLEKDLTLVVWVEPKLTRSDDKGRATKLLYIIVVKSRSHCGVAGWFLLKVALTVVWLDGSC